VGDEAGDVEVMLQLNRKTNEVRLGMNLFEYNAGYLNHLPQGDRVLAKHTVVFWDKERMTNQEIQDLDDVLNKNSV